MRLFVVPLLVFLDVVPLLFPVAPLLVLIGPIPSHTIIATFELPTVFHTHESCLAASHAQGHTHAARHN